MMKTRVLQGRLWIINYDSNRFAYTKRTLNLFIYLFTSEIAKIQPIFHMLKLCRAICTRITARISFTPMLKLQYHRNIWPQPYAHTFSQPLHDRMAQLVVSTGNDVRINMVICAIYADYTVSIPPTKINERNTKRCGKWLLSSYNKWKY